MGKPQTTFEQACSLEGSKDTFSVMIPDYPIYANPRDMLAIYNPATSGKYVRFSQIRINGDSPAATVADVYFYLVTSTNTGGSTSSQTINQLNPGGVASVCSAFTYTTAATTNTGTYHLIRGGHFALPNATTPTFAAPDGVWQFGDRAATMPMLAPGQLAVLSGSPATGTNTATASQYSWYLTMDWTEDTV